MVGARAGSRTPAPYLLGRCYSSVTFEEFARLGMGRDTDCRRDALVISLSCIVIRKSSVTTLGCNGNMRNGLAKGLGRGCHVGWLVCKFQRVLAGAE